MTRQKLDIAEPFFSVSLVSDEASLLINGRTILLNLSDSPIRIRKQKLDSLQSVILCDTDIQNVETPLLSSGLMTTPTKPFSWNKCAGRGRQLLKYAARSAFVASAITCLQKSGLGRSG